MAASIPSAAMQPHERQCTRHAEIARVRRTNLNLPRPGLGVSFSLARPSCGGSAGRFLPKLGGLFGGRLLYTCPAPDTEGQHGNATIRQSPCAERPVRGRAAGPAAAPATADAATAPTGARTPTAACRPRAMSSMRPRCPPGRPAPRPWTGTARPTRAAGAPRRAARHVPQALRGPVRWRCRAGRRTPPPPIHPARAGPSSR